MGWVAGDLKMERNDIHCGAYNREKTKCLREGMSKAWGPLITSYNVSYAYGCVLYDMINEERVASCFIGWGPTGRCNQARSRGGEGRNEGPLWLLVCVCVVVSA